MFVLQHFQFGVADAEHLQLAFGLFQLFFVFCQVFRGRFVANLVLDMAARSASLGMFRICSRPDLLSCGGMLAIFSWCC